MKCARWAATLGWLAMAAVAADAQEMPLEDEPEVQSEAARKYREFLSPEAQKEAEEKRLQPPFEFYRTQVAPFDVLPFVKPNHWAWLTQEMEANLGDYRGMLRTAPVPLLGMPKNVIFRESALLPEGESRRLSWPVFLPSRTKQLDIDLVRPGTIRPDDGTQAPMTTLEPHQMLIVVLADDPSAYNAWRSYQALIPATTDLGQAQEVERRSYYKLVIPQDPDEPNLSSHPLTWTTISHVVWDGLDPNTLDTGQRRALVDWLHWGGQLIIAGGATPTLAILSDDESFLAPYLPGAPSGENTSLEESDLLGLSRAYPPPDWKYRQDDFELQNFGEVPNGGLSQSFTTGARPPDRYREWQPIDLPPERPMYLAGLDRIAADATWITDPQGHRLGIERRVGRGRILMLAFDPKEAGFMNWRGNDTFVRRVLLRRPEDNWNPNDPNDASMLGGPSLSWVRFLGRDLGADRVSGEPDPSSTAAVPGAPTAPPIDAIEAPMPKEPVAAWLDDAAMPDLSRRALVEASGIEVPGSRFVLRVIVAYIAALVPLNWLLCRFVLRRRELAWAVAPVLAMGFAVAVERAAAIDMGYDRACDEVDLLELQPGYPRAHLSRFAVLYSTGREQFAIRYPRDPTALALPLNTKLSQRGEASTESVYEYEPGPALIDFQVEPRSLAMFRSEQLRTVPVAEDLPEDVAGYAGRIGLEVPEEGEGPSRLINGTGLELRDALLVGVGAELDGANRYTPIGTVLPGGVVDLPGAEAAVAEVSPPSPPEGGDPYDWIDLDAFLGPLRSYNWRQPADVGETRLVAWVAAPMGGQELDPAVDRHRGFTLVVVHLRYGPPPTPDLRTYDQGALATGAAAPPSWPPRKTLP